MTIKLQVVTPGRGSTMDISRQSLAIIMHKQSLIKRSNPRQASHVLQCFNGICVTNVIPKGREVRKWVNGWGCGDVQDESPGNNDEGLWEERGERLLGCKRMKMVMESRKLVLCRTCVLSKMIRNENML